MWKVNFSRAAGVHVSKHGEELVYVAEYFSDPTMLYSPAGKVGPRITVLNRDGEVLARLGEESYGDEPGRFYAPHFLATDSKGNIYEAEVAYSEYGAAMDPPRELRSLQKLVLQR